MIFNSFSQPSHSGNLLEKLFSSLTTKIIFFIVVIMVITSLITMYYTRKYAGRAMLKAQEISAINILNFVELTIKEDYQRITYERLNTIAQRKEQLQILSKAILSVLNEYASLSEKEYLTLEEAQNTTLDWLRQFYSIRKDAYCFIFDKNSSVLVHSDPAFQGTSVANIQDMTGKSITELINNQEQNKGEFATFYWTPSGNPSDNSKGKKLGYFLSFPKWEWSIGAVIEIDDIEARFKKSMDENIKALKETFSNIYVSKNGGIFLFDGKKEMLIPPPYPKGVNYSSVKNDQTGNLLLDDLMRTAALEENYMEYIIPPRTSDDPRIGCLVSYFQPLDWYMGVNAPVQDILLPARNLVHRQLMIIATLFLISLVIIFYFIKRITHPLNVLADYAKELPSHDFTSDKKEEKSPIDIFATEYNDEVGRLAKSFVFMKAELKKNIKNLMDTTAAKERIESELNVARKIQLGILPKIFPPFPDRKEFDLYATLESAKEVGGDLYDFFFIDDEHLCFTVGDVSDKGVPAALFMMVTRTMIKTMTQPGVSPADVMTRMNDILSVENPNAMFVTLFIGILNIHTGDIVYSNGGHNPPVVISSEGVAYKKGVSGLVVGGMEGIPYKELSLQLNPGDSLILYSDGVTEAKDPENKQFTDARLLTEVEAVKEKPVEDIVSNIMSKVKEHAATAPQSDDITVLMFRYYGSDE